MPLQRKTVSTSSPVSPPASLQAWMGMSAGRSDFNGVKAQLRCSPFGKDLSQGTSASIPAADEEKSERRSRRIGLSTVHGSLEVQIVSG